MNADAPGPAEHLSRQFHPKSVLQYGAGSATVPVPAQKRIMAQVSKLVSERQTNMGDKSPKATHKKATQKQAKATSANQKKQQAVAAKQVANLKR